MAGTFLRRTEELSRRVGHGRIEASVKIDQIYAEYQHNIPELRHPTGGKAFFLTDALIGNFPRWYQQIANHLYSPLGVNHWMIRISDNFASQTKRRMPYFLGDLSRSTQPRVKQGGAFIYEGSAKGRMSKNTLRAKARLYSKMHPRPKKGRKR